VLRRRCMGLFFYDVLASRLWRDSFAFATSEPVGMHAWLILEASALGLEIDPKPILPFEGRVF